MPNDPSAALDQLNTDLAAAETTALEQPPAEPAEPAPAVEAVPAAPAADDFLDPSTLAGKKIKVKVDGEEIPVDFTEAIAGYSRTSKFTREMQKLAEEKRQFDTNADQLRRMYTEHQQMARLLQSREDLQAYLQHQGWTAAEAAAATEAATPPNPEELATVGDIHQQLELRSQQMLAQIEQRLAQLDQSVSQRTAAATQQAMLADEQARHAAKIEPVVRSVFTEHPILNTVPEMEDILRYRAFKTLEHMPTATVDDAIQAFRSVAKEQVDLLHQGYAKAQASRTTLAAEGIEPPGGKQVAPPAPPEFTYNDESGAIKIDWDKLGEATLAAMNGPDLA